MQDSDGRADPAERVKAERARWAAMFGAADVPSFRHLDIPKAEAFERPVGDLLKNFDQEARHPSWADAMEESIRKRIDPKVLAGMGLGPLQLSSLDCRTSACEFTFEYPATLSERVVSAGLPADASPVWLYIFEKGAFGSKGDLRKSEAFTRNGTTWKREVSVVSFEEAAMDPRTYHVWAQRSVESMQGLKQSMKGSTP